MTYKINLGGIAFMIWAALTFSGAFGGAEFRRGVAGLLVLAFSDIWSVVVESRAGWVKLVTIAMIPAGIGITIWGFVLVFGGL